MKIFYIILLTAGLTLMGFNIAGLFKSLRNDDIYSELTPYKNDISISCGEAKDKFNRNKDESDKEYALRVCMLINDAMAHYWKDEGIKKYNLRVPVWENWLLALKLSFSETKKYEFRNYKKAVERGVGICSQPCIALQNLLVKKGIEADLWDLWGHVVVDAKFSDGTRCILDPDYGQYVPYGMEEIMDDPEIVRAWYADQDDVYADHVTEHKHTDDIVKMYEKDGNHIYYMKKGFENMSYILKWVLPVLLIIPFLLTIFKKN